jgi:prepilin peptidase CpaA
VFFTTPLQNPGSIMALAAQLAPFQIILLGCVTAMLVWCAISDIRARIIPHSAIFAIAGAYAIYLLAGYGDWQSGALAAMLMFALGFLLFHLNMMGGGDSKMIATVGLWVGTGQLGAFLFYTAIAGGVVALSVLVAQRCRVQGSPAATEAAPTVPYGVAIAFGGAIALWRSALNGIV